MDGPSTRGWWSLEEGREFLALVQPYGDEVSIVLYNGPHPWKQKRVSAPSVRQAKKFAERWVRPRLKLWASGAR